MNQTAEHPTSTLTYAMVGGGEGSFIGDVHRKAIAFDGKAALIAGCFSQNPEKGRITGHRLGLSEDRIYPDFGVMAEKESARADRPDFVVVVTANHTHYEICKVFLERGFHIVCDKPLTVTVEQARELEALARAKGLLACVTYSYSGCAMVKQAREIIRSGQIGTVQVVSGEYPQGWMAQRFLDQPGEPLPWRADPVRAGRSNCVGDIGTHVAHMVEYMTGLKIRRLYAKLDAIGPDMVLDTNATVMVEYDSGAVGTYWASQVALGCDNGLKIRIFGTKGSLEWRVEDPDRLMVRFGGGPTQIYVRGSGYIAPEAQGRLAAGHLEGYYEAFVHLYSQYLSALQDFKSGAAFSPDSYDFPSLAEGVRGVQFVNACADSSEQGKWVEVNQ